MASLSLSPAGGELAEVAPPSTPRDGGQQGDSAEAQAGH